MNNLRRFHCPPPDSLQRDLDKVRRLFHRQGYLQPTMVFIRDNLQYVIQRDFDTVRQPPHQQDSLQPTIVFIRDNQQFAVLPQVRNDVAQDVVDMLMSALLSGSEAVLFTSEAWASPLTADVTETEIDRLTGHVHESTQRIECVSVSYTSDNDEWTCLAEIDRRETAPQLRDWVCLRNDQQCYGRFANLRQQAAQQNDRRTGRNN